MASGWIDMEGMQITSSADLTEPNHTLEVETAPLSLSQRPTTEKNHTKPQAYIRTFFWTLVFVAFIKINWMFQNVRAYFWEPTYASVPANDSMSRTSSLRQSYGRAIDKGYKPKTERITLNYQPVISPGRTSSASVSSSLLPSSDGPHPLLSNPPSIPCMSPSDMSPPHTDDSGMESDDVFGPLEVRRCKSMPPARRKKKHSKHASCPSSSSADVLVRMPELKTVDSWGSCSHCGGGNSPQINIYVNTLQPDFNIQMGDVGSVNIAHHPAIDHQPPHIHQVPHHYGQPHDHQQPHSHWQPHHNQQPNVHLQPCPLRTHDYIPDPSNPTICADV